MTRRKKLFFAFYLLITFLIFLINTFHDEYPDEYDNILGGWYIINGKLPYRDFFTHHNPGAYFVAALVALFSRQSFVRFRVILAVFYYLITLTPFLLLKRRLKNVKLNFYLFYVLILGIAATYFWGHMLLGDTLSAYFLIPAFGLFFLKTFYEEELTLKDLGIISLFSFLTLWSSLSYSYLIGLIYFFSLLSFWTTLKLKKKKLPKRELFYALGVIALPYILFTGFLLISGSFKDHYQQSIIFNAKYYIYNYPKPEGSTRINPVRYAFIIFNNFFNDYHSLLVQLKDFNFPFPFNVALATSNTALLVYLFVKKRFKLGFFIFLTFAYSVVRSTPLFGKRDYQVAVFIMLSLFLAPFIFVTLREELRIEKEYLPKIIFTFLFLLISVYWFYNLLFIYRKFNERVFNKYMGTAPLIYDRPYIAPIINSVIEKTDYAWSGPFEFKELFYSLPQTPSKYHILLPEFARSEKIKTEMMADFQKNRPKIVMFRKHEHVRGYHVMSYADFFLEFLEANYIRLVDYQEGEVRYTSVEKPDLVVDIDANFYIDKAHKNEIITKLLEKGFIKKVEVEE